MRKRRRAKAAVYCGGGVGVCAVRYRRDRSERANGRDVLVVVYVIYYELTTYAVLICTEVPIDATSQLTERESYSFTMKMITRKDVPQYTLNGNIIYCEFTWCARR